MRRRETITTEFKEVHGEGSMAAQRRAAKLCAAKLDIVCDCRLAFLNESAALSARFTPG